MKRIHIWIGITILLYVVSYMSSENESKPTVKAKQPIVHNSSWDGSVSQVKALIKETAKDPDSIEFIEWSPVSKQSDGSFLVRAKYRGKNSFGGMTVENKIFRLDSRGVVIKAVNY